MADHLHDDGTEMTIREDLFGWFCIMQSGRQLQAFRSEAECRQWIFDVRHPVRQAGQAIEQAYPFGYRSEDKEP
jgi:hypothetical protein